MMLFLPNSRASPLRPWFPEEQTLSLGRTVGENASRIRQRQTLCMRNRAQVDEEGAVRYQCLEIIRAEVSLLLGIFLSRFFSEHLTSPALKSNLNI